MFVARFSVVAIVGSLLATPAVDAAAASPGLAGLKQLSLEQLLDLQVSTISRKEERWWSSPSGIDVVTGEDIRRAGVRNLPDALRLASGVHVAQSSARSWAVSLRGMNVLAANKISVVMDGRSLYTPFFSGVQWDAQDTLLEDIDRIEVVRGPVGALWGAFAVNGLVQILTKPAWDTQGFLASAGTGTEDPLFLSFRYGGRLGQNTFYRVYAKYAQADWTYGANGEHAQPTTDFFQSGFRADMSQANDATLTLQGDYYTNRDLPLDRQLTEVSGFNLLARWRRNFASDSDLLFRAYFDHTYRLIPANFEERRDTLAASVKFRHALGRHDLMAGFDGVLSWDEIGNIGFARLIPDERTIHTAGLYVHDTIDLVPEHLRLVLALKGEHGRMSGFNYQPTARLAWTPTPQTTFWTALSQAARPAVRIDEDLTIALGGVTFFEANDDFATETAVAYEFGVRHQPAEQLMGDISLFAYRYEDLRSTEPRDAAPVPLTFRNGLNAESYGVEVTVLYQPIAPLLFKASYRYLDLRFWPDPGSRHTTAGSAEGNDPRHLATLSVRWDLPKNVEVDALLRHASALPRPLTPAYTTADLRVGWRPAENWELELVGRNLLQSRHRELVTTNSLNEEVARSGSLEITWRY